MPELTDEELFKVLLEECVKNAVPVTLNVSHDEEEKALKICDNYINNGNIDVHDMTPLTIYYIISKLPENRQIVFIKENIDYIKEKDEDIFLYNMFKNGIKKNNPIYISTYHAYGAVVKLKILAISVITDTSSFK